MLQALGCCRRHHSVEFPVCRAALDALGPSLLEGTPSSSSLPRIRRPLANAWPNQPEEAGFPAGTVNPSTAAAKPGSRWSAIRCEGRPIHRQLRRRPPYQQLSQTTTTALSLCEMGSKWLSSALTPGRLWDDLLNIECVQDERPAACRQANSWPRRSSALRRAPSPPRNDCGWQSTAGGSFTDL